MDPKANRNRKDYEDWDAWCGTPKNQSTLLLALRVEHAFRLDRCQHLRTTPPITSPAPRPLRPAGRRGPDPQAAAEGLGSQSQDAK